MPEFVALLKSIPDVVWSGLIASVLTLSGVLLSNRSNTLRLKMQLNHDATEKAKERIAVLRRETYLRAAEELVKINAYLASLPQVDLTKVNAGEGMQGFFVAAARLQLIAEPATSLLVNKLSARYSELAFTVMGKLLPVAKAKADINIADELYQKAQAEVSRLLSEISKQNESGRPDVNVYQALRSAFDFHQAQSQQYAGEHSEAWKQFNALSFDFQRCLLQEIKEIGGEQIPVMVEIRRDLGLTGDLVEIEAFMKDQWKKMESRLDALLLSPKDG